MYDIVASIVLYKNDIVILKQTIESFLNTLLNVKLILIDNSPTDDLKIGTSINTRIDYIPNPSNPGFGAAHNIAIRKSIDYCAKYHLVLNPDVFFEKDNLEKMFFFMEANLEIGHLMPKILYPDGSLQYLCKTNPTVFDLFLRRFMPSFFKDTFKERMDKYEYKNRDYTQLIYDVPYLSGCFMFFRTSTLEKVGYFDERIFMYIEDADITRRTLQIARTVYFPNATVYHHFAKGSHKNFKLMMYSIHGAIIYFNKWGWFPRNS